MIDVAIVAIYLIVTLIVGIWVGRGVSTFKDYAVADRNFSTPLLIATMFATNIGAGATVGIAGEVYHVGIVIIVACFGSAIHELITARYFASRFPKLKNMLTAGDIMGHYYGKPGKVITGIAGLAKCVGSIGVQIGAIGIALNQYLGINYGLGVVLAYGFVVTYSAFGGIRAVALTDAIQFAVLLIAIPMVCNFGLNQIGGYENLFSSLPKGHLSLFPTGENSYYYLILFFIYCLPHMNPATVQRLLIGKNEWQIKKSLYISAALMIVYFIVVGLVGLIALSLNPTLSPEGAFPFVIQELLPTGIKGIAVAGLLAIIMSTADSYLNIAGISFVNDICKPLFPSAKALKNELMLARISTGVLGIGSIILVLKFKTILALGIWSMNFWIPIVLFPLFCALFDIKTHHKSFLHGASAGFLTVVIWEVFIRQYFNAEATMFAFAANGLAFWISHSYYKKKSGAPFSALSPLKKLRTKIIALPALQCRQLVGLPQQIVRFSEKRVDLYGAQYLAFASFSIFNYILPYFMWAPTKPQYQYAVLGLRFLSGALCIPLILHESWSKKYRHYLPIYWHLTLLFCMPFLTSFMLLESHFSYFWLINTALVLLFLGKLVDWLTYLILLPAGVIAALWFFAAVDDFSSIHLTTEQLYYAVYIYGFSTLVSLFFSRTREQRSKQRFDDFKVLGSAMAHELIQPVSSIQNDIASIRRLVTGVITPTRQQKIAEITTRISRTSKRSLGSIELLLANFKDPKRHLKSQLQDISTSVSKAVESYDFLSTERNFVNINVQDNFNTLIDQNLFNYIIHNLLKNALHLIKTHRRGIITIWTSRNRNIGQLHFKDTAKGIPSTELPYIFDQFFTTKDTGNGIGLSFCKHTIEAMGGAISCQSIENEHTEFILEFPIETISNVGQIDATPAPM